MDIKKAIRKHGLTLAQVAQAIGSTQPYLSRALQNGKQPSAQLTEKIAAALSISVEELTGNKVVASEQSKTPKTVENEIIIRNILKIKGAAPTYDHFLNALLMDADGPEVEKNAEEFAQLVWNFKPETGPKTIHRICEKMSDFIAEMVCEIIKKHTFRPSTFDGPEDDQIDEEDDEIDWENDWPDISEGDEKDASENDDEDDETPKDRSQLWKVNTELKPIQTIPVVKKPIVRKGADSYPLFNPDDIDDMIDNPELAGESVMKCFIYHMWMLMAEVIDSYTRPIRVDDEDDTPYSEPLDMNIDKEVIDEPDFRRLLVEAYNTVDDAIEAGFFTDHNDNQHDLKFSEHFDSKLISQIFKWEKHWLGGKTPVYAVTKEHIYDVTAQIVARPNTPETLEEMKAAQKDARVYASKLFLINNFHDNPERILTPFEFLLANIIEDYMTPRKELADYGVELKMKIDRQKVSSEAIVTRDGWREMKSRAVSAGFTESELLGCLWGCSGPDKFEQLRLQSPPFYAEAIRTTNKIHGYVSQIDEIDHQKLLELF